MLSKCQPLNIIVGLFFEMRARVRFENPQCLFC